MKLFLDTANLDEIREIAAWGVLAGVTTNPMILAREEDVAVLQHLRDIVQIVPGPVSVEVVSQTQKDMVQEAQELARGCPRAVIKVPADEQGLRALAELTRLGVPTNATAIMSPNQALLAALAGATYVSIFAGRIGDLGYDAGIVIRQTRALLDAGRSPTQIIVGSIRQVVQVHEALLAGAHIVTVPYAIIKKMIKHPMTEATIREFLAAWQTAQQGART